MISFVLLPECGDLCTFCCGTRRCAHFPTVAVPLDTGTKRLAVSVRRITWRVAVLTVAATTAFTLSPVFLSNASTLATPPNSTSLFSVSRILKLDTDGSGPSIVATGTDSMFVVGTFDRSKGAVDDLIRIDLKTWRIAAAARFPNVTSVAFGDGALWWATGQNAFDIPAPDNGRVLLKIDPGNLHRESTYILPGRTVLVTVAGSSLWVATPTMLIRLDPQSGRVLVKVPVDFSPTEMSSSEQGRSLDVLGAIGSKEFVTTYDATSGRRLVQRLLPGATGQPLTTTAQGVWVAVDNLNNKTATARYYEGDRLVPSAARGGYPFDTSLYPGVGVIWLVDSAGQGSTECLAQSTGHVRASGGPLGVWGSVATYAGRTYVLFERDLTDYFLRVQPSKSCS
jgi:hypothetical protein